jgi:hippurate hydrolase
MIRGDMDALPVQEETGLPYASEVRMAGVAGGPETGVMHACGHDVHTTALVGTARLLASTAARAQWRGVLMIVAQPAEEVGEGARRMIGDGLFERFPRPDYALALHVDAFLPAGRLETVPGWARANVDSVDITIHGRSGHGARPHQAVDPILAASQLVVALQTLVSRRVDPLDPAVVTVGSIHGGTKHNQIPDQVKLQLTVRSYSDASRELLLDGIRQLAVDVCRAFECPRPPDVSQNPNPTPSLYNDPVLDAAVVRVLRGALGQEFVATGRPAMGGEDFGRYSRELGIPAALFFLGSVAPETFHASQQPGGDPLPSLHSSRYAPEPQITLRTGVRALAHLALALLAPPESRDSQGK